MKIIKSIVLSALMVLAMNVSAQKKTIHLLALNDMHAYIDNAPALGGIIDSLRGLYPELMVFSSGDNRTGNPINDECDETNRPMMEIMNAFGVKASAIGNHEFDGKQSGFRKNAEVAEFPFLCANVKVNDTLGFRIDPYKIFDVDGVRLGVVSCVQVNPRGIPDCLADNVAGLTFSDPFAAAEKYGEIVRKQCDVEILLSHNGIENDTVWAFKLGNYDAILGGHSHTYVESNTFYNGVLYTQSLNKMKYCTLVEFVLEDGQVIDKSSKIIKVGDTKLHSKKLEDMLKKFNNNPSLMESAGKLAKPINNVWEMGSMVADAQQYVAQTQLIVQNYGGIRYETHPAGDFTIKDAKMLDPFGNIVHIFKVNGAELKKIIEQTYIGDEERIPFVAGFKYDIVVDKKTKQVKAVHIFNEKGKKIKDKKTFTVGCNNYVVSITFLKDRDGKSIGKKTSECLIEYFRAKGPLDYTNIVRNKLIEE